MQGAFCFGPARFWGCIFGIQLGTRLPAGLQRAPGGARTTWHGKEKAATAAHDLIASWGTRTQTSMFALLVLSAALLAPRLSSPRARGCRCFITAAEPISFDAWSLPALLPNLFTNGGESVVSVERVEVYSEKLGWVTQIRGIEVTPAGVELGLGMFALLVYSRVQRERRGWLPGSGWQARAEEEEKKKGKGR